MKFTLEKAPEEEPYLDWQWSSRKPVVPCYMEVDIEISGIRRINRTKTRPQSYKVFLEGDFEYRFIGSTVILKYRDNQYYEGRSSSVISLNEETERYIVGEFNKFKKDLKELPKFDNRCMKSLVEAITGSGQTEAFCRTPVEVIQAIMKLDIELIESILRFSTRNRYAAKLISPEQIKTAQGTANLIKLLHT